MEYLVPDNMVDTRLDQFLASVSEVSRTKAVELISLGQIQVNGKNVDKSYRVQALDQITANLELPKTQLLDIPPIEPIKIFYQDQDLVVIDKPKDVAVHASVGWSGATVVAGLKELGIFPATSGAPERQGIVQRLDAGTTGVMVVALSEVAYSRLKNQFRSREVTKLYHALVQGHPDPSEGTIDAPLDRLVGQSHKFAVIAGGKPSVTHYRTLESWAHASLLEVKLETGRTHQIRVHMQAIRHPCVGDALYGADPTLTKRLGLDRQWLHAFEISFIHPITNEPLTFNSSYSEDLEKVLQLLNESY
ncbi:MAG: RluA family pseudouridine synthase [Candidatus Nanopelagicales bacterium]